ncbi:zinc finger MIZ domain-containing protein 2 isoform X1 [Chironomus tepperi]|uniref:zinc finger MIZ domain-containing protein 2 isoform X1 n=2 Tax=Chironomus tepperi TaxID=113505 RepID=UPI00391FA3D4
MNNHGSSVGATRNRGGNPTDKITPNVYYHHTLEPQATTIEHQQQLQQRQTNCNNFGTNSLQQNHIQQYHSINNNIDQSDVIDANILVTEASSVSSNSNNKSKRNTATSKSRNANNINNTNNLINNNATPIHMSSNNSSSSSINRTNNNHQQLTPGASSSLSNQVFNNNQQHQNNNISQYANANNNNYSNQNNHLNSNFNMVAAGQQGGMDVGYNSQMNNMGMHSQNSWNNQINSMGGNGNATNAGNGNNMGNMSNMNGMINGGMMNQMNQMNTMHGNGGNPMQMGNMNNMSSMNAQMNGAMNFNNQRHHQSQINPMAQMANMGMSSAATNGSGGHQMSTQMNGMNPINQMNPMAKMQGMANGYAPPRRMSPYPNPQMHTAQKRAAMYGMGGANQVPPSGPAMSQFPQHQGAVPIPIQNQYSRPGQNPMNPYGRSPSMMPTNRQNTPPYNNSAAQQYYGNAGANAGYQNIQGFHQQDGRNLNYQHSPVPGNPTPPLTPASSMTPYISPNPDVKPNIVHSEELRLTFPVRDGIILPPFRLEHNLAVSNHVFQLKPTVYNTLMCRSDLELQLKCFHHEDRQMNTNWPASVQVSANSTPLEIDRGENKNTHRPLYLKQVCQPGRNTIQITVSTCCCSHLFVLQLVHRPSVRHVLHTLLRRNLLPAEHAVAKIKRSFAQGHIQSPQTNPSGVPTIDKDGSMDQQQSLKVFLKCPITCKRITLPARGHDCKHIQCFDLEAYLQINCERGNWRCPVCNKPALTEGLEIDQYMWAILNTLTSQQETEEVMIDAQANWKAIKPMNINGIKQEPLDPDSGKQFNKVMSPGSTSLPSWDNMQAMSPYMSPDMNSIASGSMMNQNYNQRNQQFDPYGNPIKDPMSGDFNSNSSVNGVNNPLAHLNESVNSLDPLNAMEKTLNDQMPHTPHTPNGGHNNPMTPGGPPSVPSVHDNVNGTNSNNSNSPQHQQNILNSASNIMNSPQSLMNSPQNMMNSPQNMNQNMQQNLMNSIPNLTDVCSDLTNADLNFDPAAVIDGEGGNDLNLLPDNVNVDPLELLSYLDPPPDLNTPPSSGSSNNANNDDFLAVLFD